MTKTVTLPLFFVLLLGSIVCLIGCSKKSTVYEGEFCKEIENSTTVKNVELFMQWCNLDVNATDSHGGTLLREAAYSNNLDVVKYLVEKGADVNAKDRFEHTPLYLTSNPDVVKYLVEKGADVYAKDDDGMTPLHAVTLGYVTIKEEDDRLKIVKNLIEKGADVNAKDNDGTTPLKFAISNIRNGRLDIMKYLIEKGADVNAKNNRGNTPLHAVSNLDVMKYLVEKGADVNAKNEKGKTPLHRAALSSNVDEMKYLIEKGADVNAKDNDWNTALHVAAQYAYIGNTQYKRYDDLVKAIMNDRKVEFLIAKRADVNAKNNKGQSIQDIAKSRATEEVAKWEKISRELAEEHARARKTQIGADVYDVRSVLGEPNGTSTRTHSDGTTTGILEYKKGNSTMMFHIKDGKVVEVGTYRGN